MEMLSESLRDCGKSIDMKMRINNNARVRTEMCGFLSGIGWSINCAGSL